MIKKELTEIKATVNPTNMLVTCNKNSTDKTTENSDNVIDMTIQNNNKEPLKNKKNTNKNFADSKTLNTADVLSIPQTKSTRAKTEKTRRRLTTILTFS